MASRSDIQAGKAHVSLYLQKSQLVQGLRAMGSQISSWASSMVRTVQAIGRSMQMVGGALVGFGAAGLAAFAKPIQMAGDAAEAMSKFGAVFGTEATAAGKFADELAAKVGRSALDIKDSMSAYMAMFQGLGFDPAQARQMSQQLQQLAIDFGSFHNLTDAEASERFLAGLSGSSEVFDKFGINTKAAAIDTELLAMGLDKTTATATENEKVMARINIMMRSLGAQGAIGDAVRTSDSLSNQMKRLKGTLKDAAVAIGSALIPIVTPLVGLVTKVVTIASRWIQENQELIKTVFKVTAGVVAAGAAIYGIGQTLVLLANPISLAIGAVAGLGYAIWKYTDLGKKAVGFLMEKFNQLKDYLKPIIEGISNAFKAGDLSLAGKVLMTALTVAFEQGKLALLKVWIGLKNEILTIWDGVTIGFMEAISTIVEIWSVLSPTIIRAFEPLSEFFSGYWEKFEKAARSAFAVVSSWANVAKLGFDSLMKTFEEFMAGLRKLSPEVEKEIAGKGGTIFNVATGKTPEQVAAEIQGELERGFRDFASKMGDRGAGRSGGDKAAIEAQQKRIEAAQAEFNRAADEARRAAAEEELRRAKAAAGAGVSPGGIPAVNTEGLAKSVVGTYSAAAAQALGGGSFEQKALQSWAELRRATIESNRQSAKDFAAEMRPQMQELIAAIKEEGSIALAGGIPELEIGLVNIVE